MNKTELITEVAVKADLSKKDAENAVVAVFDTIKETLAKGEKIAITGFGTFSVRTRAAREGLNPLTKEPMLISEAKVPTFKAGTLLKNAVR